MEKLYLLDDAIISPLGFSTEENMQHLRAGKSGLELQQRPKLSSRPFYAGMIDNAKLNNAFSSLGDVGEFTKLEKMCLLAINGVLEKNPNLSLSDTALIISTTKGNIDLLQGPQNVNKNRVVLAEFGKCIADFFGFKKTPIILSNACILADWHLQWQKD
jgi:3-oxoacyl-[acyl-carrier-protein] synthase-1